jgi:hypothetical protein
MGQDDVRKHSDEELEHQILHAGWNSPHYTALIQERQRRHWERLQSEITALKKPHPAVWWTLVVAVLTLIVCLIGYWDQIIRFLRAMRFWR